jgi:predicted nucleic-acid-binding Zn-ribbon protein
MKIKGNIGKEKFTFNPSDDHYHCHRTLGGEHMWIDNIGTQGKPFLFWEIRRKSWNTVTCLACGMVKFFKEVAK